MEFFTSIGSYIMVELKLYSGKRQINWPEIIHYFAIQKRNICLIKTDFQSEKYFFAALSISLPGIKVSIKLSTPPTRSNKFVFSCVELRAQIISHHLPLSGPIFIIPSIWKGFLPRRLNSWQVPTYLPIDSFIMILRIFLTFYSM